MWSWMLFCRSKEIGVGLFFHLNSTAELVPKILKPQTSHQLHTLEKESWHSWFNRVTSDPHSQKHKSSAYNAAGAVIFFDRSLIIREKSMELTTLPCDVPFSRRLVIDAVDPVLTWKVRLERKTDEVKHATWNAKAKKYVFVDNIVSLFYVSRNAVLVRQELVDGVLKRENTIRFFCGVVGSRTRR